MLVLARLLQLDWHRDFDGNNRFAIALSKCSVTIEFRSFFYDGTLYYRVCRSLQDDGKSSGTLRYVRVF